MAKPKPFPPVPPRPAAVYAEYRPDRRMLIAQERARQDQPPLQTLVSKASNAPLWEK